MNRWLQRSYAGARRHLSRTLRTLACALLTFSVYLLRYLSARGISGTTRGALGWLEAWLVVILQPLSHAGRALPRLTSAAHSLLWLLHLNATHRCSAALSRLGETFAWLLFSGRLALALLVLARQHWAGPRALPIARLPRAARTRPETNAVAVTAATAAALAATATPPDAQRMDGHPPHSTSAAAIAPPPPRGRVGYALKLGKSRAKSKLSHALPARSDAPTASFWPTNHTVTRWLRVVIDSGCTWHVHDRLEDLSNVVPCSDIIVDANGHRVTCAFKGDLPLLAQDTGGKEFRIMLRGVRYSPSFEDTLISVDQLWYSSDIDTRFRSPGISCIASNA